MTSPKRIVLLDLWTDTNRGDSALQAGLISMVRDRWPGSQVFGVFRFGTNEIREAYEEISDTVNALDGFSGGVRRTYYSAPNFGRFPLVAAKLISLYSFIELFFVVLAFKLGLHFILPEGKKTALRQIRNADLVIWKGKNFRDYGGIAGINRQLTLLSAGLLAGCLNRNLHCVNASVWSMRNRMERWLTRRAFLNCRTITVREPGSLEAVRALNLGDLPVYFAQDLSFYALSRNHQATGILDNSTAREYDVALTITQWGGRHEQEKYLQTLLACITKLAEAGARRFVIVPQVTRSAEDNSKLVAALQQHIQPNSGISLTRIEAKLGISEILAVYRQSALLVGTRMHSCVFAMSVGTPFVAIAYDVGPKWDILRQFWPAEFIFEYGSDPADVADAASNLYRDPERIRARASQRFQELAAESFDNVRFI